MSHKIVVLDGEQMNPGDLDWDGLAKLGELDIYASTSPEEVVKRSIDADILVINKIVLSADVQQQLPNLKMIAVTATGYDNVDIAFAKSSGITVANAVNYSTASVTQYVFSCIFDALQGVAEHAASVKNGEWSARGTFSYSLFPVSEWHTQTLGIIGLGNIGQSVARLGQKMGMNVIAWNRTEKELNIDQHSLNTVLEESDFLTLHLPLNKETFHFIDEKRLLSMKHSAYLINAGRGDLIDAISLVNVLDKGHLKGAYLDVLPVEPPDEQDPVVLHSKVKVTPHLAWSSVQAREKLMAQTIENIRAFQEGEELRVL